MGGCAMQRIACFLRRMAALRNSPRAGHWLRSAPCPAPEKTHTPLHSTAVFRMMTLREKWARNIALLTGVLVLLLALMFAVLQNPAHKQTAPVNEATDISATPELPPDFAIQKQAVIAAGRAVFEAQACMRCHAVADEGNQRNPLDGVGKRRTAEEIRQWILAPAELKDQLSAWPFQAKQAYRELPAEDIDALVIYLQSLKTPPPAN